MIFKQTGGYSAQTKTGRAPKPKGPAARPKGSYGSGGHPAKAQRKTTDSKGAKAQHIAPTGKHAAKKPVGGYGTHGKPNPKGNKAKVTVGEYGSDGVTPPRTGIPKDQKTGRFNMPKGKFI